MKRSIGYIVIMIAMLLTTIPAYAESTALTGSISGKIVEYRDYSWGRATYDYVTRDYAILVYRVSGADLNAEIQEYIKVVCDDSGNYTIPGLPIGSYILVISEKPSYALYPPPPRYYPVLGLSKTIVVKPNQDSKVNDIMIATFPAIHRFNVSLKDAGGTILPFAYAVERKVKFYVKAPGIGWLYIGESTGNIGSQRYTKIDTAVRSAAYRIKVQGFSLIGQNYPDSCMEFRIGSSGPAVFENKVSPGSVVTYSVASGDDEDGYSYLVDIAPPALSGMAGVVKDKETGSPVPDTTVKFYNSNTSTTYEAKTDSNGQFAFSCLSGGVVCLEARPDPTTAYALEKKYLYLESGEDKGGVELLLKKGASVNISVVSAGNVLSTVPELYLCARGSSGHLNTAKTGADGKAQLILKPGTYSIGPIDASAWVAAPKTVVITHENDNKNIALSAYNAVNCSLISGKVKRSAELSQGALFMPYVVTPSAITKDNFANILPVSNLLLEKEGPYSMMTLPAPSQYDEGLAVYNLTADGIVSATVVDRKGPISANSQNIDLSFSSAGSTIEGRVTESQSPVIMAGVYLFRTSDNAPTGFTMTGKEGIFKFYNVPSGSYYASAVSPETGSSGRSPVISNLANIVLAVQKEDDPNSGPTIDQIADINIAEGESYQIRVYANDADGDRLSFSIEPTVSFVSLVQPAGANYADLYVKPTYEDAGAYNNVTIKVQDNKASYATTIFDIVVEDKNVGIENTPPAMVSLINISNKWFFWSGADKEDGSNISYSGSIDNGQWSAPTSQKAIPVYAVSSGLAKGSHTFSVKAIDSKGSESAPKSTTFYVMR